MVFDNHNNLAMPPEWHSQDAVLIAWPHADTDWNYMLDEVTQCYINIAQAITKHEKLIIITPCKHDVASLLKTIDPKQLLIFEVDTNDTWTRDYGPIALTDGESTTLLDFTFNAWGMKFAANLDNKVNRELDHQGLFKAPLINNLDMVLEGGSIESDGNGTILTTTSCLVGDPNRNGALLLSQAENELKKRLNARKVLWLNHGAIDGDDTDGHIDTLARFAPDNTILFCGAHNAQGTHHELELMKQELEQFTNVEDEHYNLVELPLPDPICDVEGNTLPATYANFLVINNAVLVPTYRQPHNDDLALSVIAQVFTGREIIGVDSVALIQQHGSLHCATMQFPSHSLNL